MKVKILLYIYQFLGFSKTTFSLQASKMYHIWIFQKELVQTEHVVLFYSRLMTTARDKKRAFFKPLVW